MTRNSRPAYTPPNKIYCSWYEGRDPVWNCATPWLAIKRQRRTEDDEEEERSRRGPMPRRRQNKTPRADLMNGERLWQLSSRKFFVCPKRRKVELAQWTWYYKEDKRRLNVFAKNSRQRAHCSLKRPSLAAPLNWPVESLLLVIIRPVSALSAAGVEEWGSLHSAHIRYSWNARLDVMTDDPLTGYRLCMSDKMENAQWLNEDKTDPSNIFRSLTNVAFPPVWFYHQVNFIPESNHCSHGINIFWRPNMCRYDDHDMYINMLTKWTE